MSLVIVLAGGTSDEREVSLRSGAAVALALVQAGYQSRLLDPIVGIDKLLPELKKADLIFPVLHGKGGEDGTLQHFLDSHSLHYIGTGEAASTMCFDKWSYSQLLRKNGILVPQTELVDLQGFRSSPLIKDKFVLKPNDGGSSIDTFIVRDVTSYDMAATEGAFSRHSHMILQKLIDGIETTVGVLGDQALPLIEIIPPQNAEFDYTNKYNGATRELCPAVNVDESQQKKAQALAVKIHKLANCQDYSRTDIIIDGDNLVVLETNTLPGMTDASLFPKAASVAGYDMPRLVDTLVKDSLRRYAAS